MNCVEWEERVALYAGGDLAPAEAQALERHVAECSGCQVLLSGLSESLALIRDAHAEPVEAAHFAAVRARVLAELERGRASRWRWMWAPALAAAAAVVLLLVAWPRPEHRIVLPMPHSLAAPLVAKVLPEPPKARLSTLQKTQKPQASEEVVMKIETDNPDVVIYWIAEKGDTK
jgi:anti-sigma factor RsiW